MKAITEILVAVGNEAVAGKTTALRRIVVGVSGRGKSAVGDRADIVLLAGETVTSAVMRRGADRTVIHDGRLVADQLDLLYPHYPSMHGHRELEYFQSSCGPENCEPVALSSSSL